MPITQQFIESMKGRRLVVKADYAPWGTCVVADPNILKARVLSCQLSMGGEIDTATLKMCGLKFGDKTTFFQPITIGYEDDSGLLNVVWRGFVLKDTSVVNQGEDGITVTALDYKWYLSKITRIRGRIYSTNGADLPVEMGSPFTAGDGKFDYERFRMDISNKAGILQNEQCVFNRDGYPDCCTDNYGLVRGCVFYIQEFSRDEFNGITADTWKGSPWNGKYWNFCTILKYIEQWWIKPYFSSFTPIRISENSYVEVSSLKRENMVPQNFSIEGSNPASAIDSIVSSLPGKWIWWVDYSSGDIVIEIRNVKNNLSQPKSLILGNDAKIATSNPMPNIYGGTVNRDATDVIKYAVSYGGAVKVLTTVRLVPLWQRYSVSGTYYDFENAADYEKWKTWNTNENAAENEKQNVEQLGLSQDQRERFPLIYRWYGIAREGDSFVDSFADRIVDMELDGDIGLQYTPLTKNVIKMFFKNYKGIRKIEPPCFDRYNGGIIVFMRDSKRVSTTPKYIQTVKTFRGSGTAVIPIKVNTRWIDCERENISLNLEGDLGVIKFDQPQYERKVLVEKDKGVGKIYDYTTAYTDMTSRTVFMTATFVTDVPAILGKKRKKNIVDNYSGMNMTGYTEANSVDIVFHADAWYPIRYFIKTSATETESVDTLDTTPIGTVLRKCDKFRGYQKYIGNGAFELFRALISYLSSYSDEEITAEIDLGIMGIGWKLGDHVKQIENSETDVIGSGFINLKCFVNRITHSARGDGKTYGTSISFTNRVNKQSSGISLMKPGKYRIDMNHPFSEVDQNALPKINAPDWEDVEKFL